MEQVISRFVTKLVQSGLVSPDNVVVGAADAEVYWNRECHETQILSSLFYRLPINSLIFAKPAQPYQAAVDFLASHADETIRPEDSETRTFLHEIPVVRRFSPDHMAKALSKRKCAYVKGYGFVAAGIISLEQAYISFSSACFACFVSFFSYLYTRVKKNVLSENEAEAFSMIRPFLKVPHMSAQHLDTGPFDSSWEIERAMGQAGRLVVALGLVDASFGNISYATDKYLYISRTGSFLDELAGEIDPIPFDGSMCTGITASSELPAHMAVVNMTGCRAVLHGHPKFCVVLSLYCDDDACEKRGLCHRICGKRRYACGYPVVSGEIGAGEYSLSKTVPEVIGDKGVAIVYGHGVFTIGALDFNGALKRMVDVERVAFDEIVGAISRHVI